MNSMVYGKADLFRAKQVCLRTSPGFTQRFCSRPGEVKAVLENRPYKTTTRERLLQMATAKAGQSQIFHLKTDEL